MINEFVFKLLLFEREKKQSNNNSKKQNTHVLYLSKKNVWHRPQYSVLALQIFQRKKFVDFCSGKIRIFLYISHKLSTCLALKDRRRKKTDRKTYRQTNKVIHREAIPLLKTARNTGIFGKKILMPFIPFLTVYRF